MPAGDPPPYNNTYYPVPTCPCPTYPTAPYTVPVNTTFYTTPIDRQDEILALLRQLISAVESLKPAPKVRRK